MLKQFPQIYTVKSHHVSKNRNKKCFHQTFIGNLITQFLILNLDKDFCISGRDSGYSEFYHSEK